MALATVHNHFDKRDSEFFIITAETLADLSLIDRRSADFRGPFNCSSWHGLLVRIVVEIF